MSRSISTSSQNLGVTQPRALVLFLWVSLPLMVLYAITRAPTVTGEDSGELAAAAYTFGIAHPPGYPLWVMLTGAFQHVVQGVNPASSANLLSGMTTAAAMGLLGLLAFRITRSVPASILGAWTVGVGSEVWNHATITEVYPLSLLLLSASLVLLARWSDSPSAGRLTAMALVFGAGLTHHPTFLFFLPLFAIGVLVLHPRTILDWRSVVGALLALIIPFVVYGQVWWAAGNDPFVSWGVERDVGSLWSHFMRDAYASGPAKTPRTVLKLFGQTAAYLQFQIAELTLAGWLLGLLGMAVLALHGGRLERLFVAMGIWGAFGLIPLLASDLEREDLFASRVFLMPAYLFFGVGIAYAAHVAVGRVPSRYRTRVAFSLLLAPALLTTVRYGEQDRSNYYWSLDYGRAILAGVPVDGALLPGGDTSTFPLIYLQACEGVRRDVKILDRSGTLRRKDALALLPEELREPYSTAPSEILKRALMRHASVAVVSMRRPSHGEVEGREILPFGLGYAAVPKLRREDADKALERQRHFLETVLDVRNEDIPTVQDHTADLIQSHLFQARAEFAFRDGNPPLGNSLLDQALSASSGIKETINNIGAQFAGHGMLERAERCFRDALAIRADYGLARRNLVVVLVQRRAMREALNEAGKGLAIDSGDSVLSQQALAAARSLDDGAAFKRVCRARMEAAPKDATPHKEFGRWMLDREHSVVAALGHFEEAARLDPSDAALQRQVARLNGSLERGDVVAKAPDATAEQGERVTLASLLDPRPDHPAGVVASERNGGRRRHALDPDRDPFAIPGGEEARAAIEARGGGQGAAFAPNPLPNLPGSVREALPGMGSPTQPNQRD